MRINESLRIVSSASLRLLGSLALAGNALAPFAAAGNGQPGSLLIYPEFDNRPGQATLLTVTNTSSTDSVNVQFHYVGRSVGVGDCTEFNRVQALTPNDTFTTVVNFHNPGQEEGFVYVVAESQQFFNQPIAFNHLVGSLTVIDGIDRLSHTFEPFSFEAPFGQGDPTDLDGDGRQDLNGEEYEATPDKILIPRFLGESPTTTSELILINLSLTFQSDVTSEMLVWNDNEEVFSTEWTFNCWDRVRLSDISLIYSSGFLRDFTNHDVNEILGMPGQESGWMQLQGRVASTPFQDFLDPAVLAVLVESSAGVGSNAALPFGSGLRSTGSLLQFGTTSSAARSPGR